MSTFSRSTKSSAASTSASTTEQEAIQKYVLDESERNLTDLAPDYFFNFPFLVELNLSNNQLWSLPLSISQCVLLEHVDISENPMSRPPAVLFSLPKLRAHPENIIFGKDQQCTKELAMEIMEETIDVNHLRLNFVDFDQSTRMVSVAPNITTMGLLMMIHPEVCNLRDSFVLVRKYKKNVLRIVLENVPISLYFLPEATYWFELKFLPNQILPSILPIVKRFVYQQCDKFKTDEELVGMKREIMEFHSEEKKDLNQLLQRLESCPKLSSLHFVVKMDQTFDPDHELVITANATAVSICDSPKSFYVFNPNAINFSYVRDIESNFEYALLTCGNKALPIDEKCVKNLLPLLSITTPELPILTKRKKDLGFLKLASRQIEPYMKGKDIRFRMHEHLYENVDDELEYLRNFKARYVVFNRIILNDENKRHRRIVATSVAKTPRNHHSPRTPRTPRSPF